MERLVERLRETEACPERGHLPDLPVIERTIERSSIIEGILERFDAADIPSADICIESLHGGVAAMNSVPRVRGRTE